MRLVFFWGHALNQEIIQIDVHEVKSTAQLLHKTLECLGCVGKSIGHAEILKKNEWCDDDRFRDDRFHDVLLHTNLVVCSH